jgi:hypothetical protein
VETFLDWFNSDLETRRAALILEIESAFSEVTKGSGSGIREAAHMEATYGPPDSTWEQRWLEARSFDEQRWQDIPSELFADWSLLGLTDVQGFKNLLPAYLCYWLNQLGTNPVQLNYISEFLGTMDMCWLVPSNIQLSTEQITCISQFTNWLNDLQWFEEEMLPTINQWLNEQGY